MLSKILIAPYIVTKRDIFLDKNNTKVMKRSYAYKAYASSYNINILNSFNPKLQLKDTESAIKKETNRFIV